MGTAQQVLKVEFVDSHFVVDGGESEGFTDAVGDKRGVADATRHVTLVGREQQDVVEVEVSGLQNPHNL